MSEREKVDAQREEAERLAHEEAEHEAAEREAEEAREKETEAEEEKHPEEKKATRGKKYALAVSPAQRLGFALAYAKIPLLQTLAPHVTHFEWRPDGSFELTLAKSLTFEVGDSTLSFNGFVTGIAEHDGLSELEGITSGAGDTDSKVLGIAGSSQGEPVLMLSLEGVRKPLKVPTPDINQTG